MIFKKSIFSLFQEMHFGLLGLKEKKEGSPKSKQCNHNSGFFLMLKKYK